MDTKLTARNILKTLKDSGQTPVIVIAALKGGVGKTTIAMLMAIRYALQGLKVLYVDADTGSQSGSDWEGLARKNTEHPLPIDCAHWPHAKVDDNVNEAKNNYDVVIVDSGGDASGVLGAAMGAATFLTLVTTANPADYRRIKPTLQAAVNGAIQRENPAFAELARIPCCVVMSRISKGKSRTAVDDVRAAITGQQIPVVEQAISDWPNWYPKVYGHHPEDPDLGQYHRRWVEIDGLIANLHQMMIDILSPQEATSG